MKTMYLNRTTGMSYRQLQDSIKRGGKFVVYGYCVSIIALTFRLTSDPYYIKEGEDAAAYRGPYTFLSLILGWWGIPWGPIYTVDMIKINRKSGGGIDVTNEIMSKLQFKYGGDRSDKVEDETMSVEFAPGELTR
jgi:hypothetical protein